MSLGSPPAELWAGVLSVDAAAFGPEAWAVCKPDMEQMLAYAGYALAIAKHGDAVVGFSSAVAITEQCAEELIAADYEERDITAEDLLPAGDQPFWYGTATCLLPQWRHQGIGRALLAARLSVVGQASRGQPKVTVVAHMWSEEGRRLFSSFGARDVGPASMALVATPKDLAHGFQGEQSRKGFAL